MVTFTGPDLKEMIRRGEDETDYAYLDAMTEEELRRPSTRGRRRGSARGRSSADSRSASARSPLSSTMTWSRGSMIRMLDQAPA